MPKNLDILTKTPKLTMVQAYKYNGWLYHTWQPLYVYDKNKDYLCCVSKSLCIMTSKKNSNVCFRYCQEQCYTCWFFFEREWFNVKITINLEEKTITYYINIASPYLLENGIVKYIDFDIDFKCIKDIKSNHVRWQELDLKEYYENKKKYHYPENITEIIKKAKKRIDKLIDVKYFIKTFSYTKLMQCIKDIDFDKLEPTIIHIEKPKNDEVWKTR